MQRTPFSLLLAVVLVVSFARFSPASAQVSTSAFRYSFPLLTSYPPLSTDMSYEVMQGYIYADSISRVTPLSTIAQFINSLSYADSGSPGDTLRKALMYHYMMKDYDPIRFFQWMTTNPTPTYYATSPGYSEPYGLEHLMEVKHDTNIALNLLNSDYILLVHVTDTMHATDTNAHLARSIIGCYADVVNVIKGQVLPPCGEFGSGAAPVKRSGGELLPCIRFEYRKEWARVAFSEGPDPRDSLMVDAAGDDWVKPGNDYLVFLTFHNLGHDTSYNYATLYPTLFNSTTMGIYPVVGGAVVNNNRDLGWGLSMPVTQFINRLNNRIFNITHPKP